MTVKELKEKLNNFPDDMEIFVPSATGNYEYGRAYSVRTMELYIELDEEIDAVVIDEQ